MDNSKLQSSRYAVYARVASDLAGENSVTEQMNACIEAAAGINPILTLADGCVFIELGVSGNAVQGRPGLSALLGRAAERPRPFDHVLMTDTARLAGNLGKSFAIIDTLRHHGVEVHFVSEGLRSTDPNFQFLMSFRNRIDYEFIRAFEKKVRSGLKARVMKGYSTGGRCFGYASHPDISSSGRCVGIRLRVSEVEGATVQRIYAAFANGVDAPEIAKTLNEEQVPGPRDRKSGCDNVGAWTSKQVYAVLRQPRYRGNVHWGRTEKFRHPVTNQIVTRRRPESEVLRVAAHDLAIVDVNLTRTVDERLAAMLDRSLRSDR